MTTNKYPARPWSLRFVCKAALLLTGLLWAAGARAAEPADVLKAAVEKLATGGNYTWTKTFIFPDAPISPGPMNGQIDASGFILVSQNVGKGDFEAVLKDGVGVLHLPVGWLSAPEIAQGNPEGAVNAALLMSRVLFSVRKPDVEAAELLKLGASFTQDDQGVITERLKEAGVVTLIRNGVTGRPNPQMPPMKEVSGTVKYWVNAGLIEKYEVSLQAKFLPSAFKGGVDFKPTTTVAFTNVGSTKVLVPDAARARLAEIKAQSATAK